MQKVEIDASVYDPSDPEFIRNPWPVLDRMLSDYPVAYHTGLKAWLVAPHDLAWEVTRNPRFSTRFADWNDAPPPKPESEWSLFDRAQARSLVAVSRADHLRLRKLTAPAFSRQVTSQIEDRIRDVISEVFDEISDPREFNAAAEIAVKIPIRTIAAMVGVPPEARNCSSTAWAGISCARPARYTPRTASSTSRAHCPACTTCMTW